AAHGADRPDRRGSRALPRSHPTLRRRDRQEHPISARLDDAGRRNHDESGAEHHRRAAECTQSSPGKTAMNPQIAYESVHQTLRILIPEFIVLAAGVAMMTAAPFFRWPRRT